MDTGQARVRRQLPSLAHGVRTGPWMDHSSAWAAPVGAPAGPAGTPRVSACGRRTSKGWVAGARRPGQAAIQGQVEGLCPQPCVPLETAQPELASAAGRPGLQRAWCQPPPHGQSGRPVHRGGRRGRVCADPGGRGELLCLWTPETGPLRLVPRPDPDLMAEVGAAGRTFRRRGRPSRLAVQMPVCLRIWFKTIIESLI